MTYTGWNYEDIENKYGSSHERRTIDGRIVGSSKCIGYCAYDGHPGHLTAGLRREHDCCKKGCHYYIPKPRHTVQPAASQDDIRQKLMMLIQA